MQWRLSYTQQCIICMFEVGVNSSAALFCESTSSQVKWFLILFFFVNRSWMLLARIVFSRYRIFATILMELCSTLVPDALPYE